MTRLIDADELAEIINWTFAKPPFSRKTVQKMIDMARTIDAVQVIRCKDCMNWKPKDEGIGEFGECIMLSKMTCYISRTISNYYCAMAQPKDKKNETES